MRWLLVLAALGGPALPLRGQSPPSVTVGSKIRLRLSAGNGKFFPRFDGTVVGINGDTLTLRPRTGGGSRRYGRSTDHQLLMLTARTPVVAKGATIGALVGVMAAGFVATLGGQSCGGNGVICYSRRHLAVRNAAVLGGAGLLTGGVIGALSPRHTWTRVWLPTAGPASAMGGGFQLGVSIFF